MKVIVPCKKPNCPKRPHFLHPKYNLFFIFGVKYELDMFCGIHFASVFK